VSGLSVQVGKGASQPIYTALQGMISCVGLGRQIQPGLLPPAWQARPSHVAPGVTRAYNPSEASLGHDQRIVEVYVWILVSMCC